MRPIGGYFELFLPESRNFPLTKGLFVNSGRSALQCILQNIGSIRRLYLPLYTCDSVLEPIVSLGIEHAFYHIDDNLEIASLPHLGISDYIVVNNYFGIKDSYVRRLQLELANHVIVDNSQALFFFNELTPHLFYSPRKFVPLADGA